MRDSFIFYRSFYEAIRGLDKGVQGEIYTAIMEYSLYGNETADLKPIARSIFTLIKPQLDANIQRYKNGKKGGKPKGNETKAKPNNNQSETKSEPNKNYNVNNNSIKENIIKETFEEFRKKYPGTKRGLDTEFEYFCKKHKDHKDVVFLLLPALNNLINWRQAKELAEEFIPPYANLQTWINQRRWEAELEPVQKTNPNEQSQQKTNTNFSGINIVG